MPLIRNPSLLHSASPRRRIGAKSRRLFVKRFLIVPTVALGLLSPTHAQQMNAPMTPSLTSAGAAMVNGTGAPNAASLADRATDGGTTFNLKSDFGAKCDGTTDDTAAIQAWLAKAAPGVQLVAPAGTCLFSTPVSAPTASSYSIVGAGVGASVLKYAGAATSSNLIALGAGTETGVVVRGFSVMSLRPVSGATVQVNGAAFTPDDGGSRYVVNVLAFGADPAGASDSTAAFNAAFASGTNFNTASDGYHPKPCVYVPAGNYKITDAVTLPSVNGCLFGDGRGLSTLTVSSGSFNLSAPGVIVLPSNGGGTAAEVHDIDILFSQPDTTSRAALVAFPPAIYARDAGRPKIRNVRIGGGSSCIDARGNTGGGIYDNVECGALVAGLMLGSNPANPNGDPGALDGVHIHGWHFWDFGFPTSGLQAIYCDTNNVSMQIGRVDWLSVTDSQNFCGNIVYLAEAQNSTDEHQWTNVSMDGGYWIQQGGLVEVSNMQNASSGASVPAVISLSTNGNTKLWVRNAILGSGSTSAAGLVNVAAGSLELDGGSLACPNSAYSCVQVPGGSVSIENMLISGASGNSECLIAQSGGSLRFMGNYFVSAGSGSCGIGFASDAGWNWFSSNENNMGGWTAQLPSSITSTNTYYGTTWTGALTASGAITTTSGAIASTSTIGTAAVYVASASGSTAGLVFESGGVAEWAAKYDGGTGDFWLSNGDGSVNLMNCTSAGSCALGASGSTTNIAGSLGVNSPATFNSWVQLPVLTWSSLGGACTSGRKGVVAVQSDFNGTPTYNQTLSGGGGSTVGPVFCDGANWRAH